MDAIYSRYSIICLLFSSSHFSYFVLFSMEGLVIVVFFNYTFRFDRGMLFMCGALSWSEGA